MKWLDNISLALIIIGALNWLLVGALRFDLVAAIFGEMSILSRTVYIIVGICGLYALTIFGRISESRN